MHQSRQASHPRTRRSLLLSLDQFRMGNHLSIVGTRKEEGRKRNPFLLFPLSKIPAESFFFASSQLLGYPSSLRREPRMEDWSLGSRLHPCSFDLWFCDASSFSFANFSFFLRLPPPARHRNFYGLRSQLLPRSSLRSSHREERRSRETRSASLLSSRRWSSASHRSLVVQLDSVR